MPKIMGRPWIFLLEFMKAVKAASLEKLNELKYVLLNCGLEKLLRYIESTKQIHYYMN